MNESEALLRTVPGIADVRRARQDGRPELAVRVDRDKAAIFGLSVTGVADTLRTNVAGTQAAFYRERGQEYPIVVRLRQEDREHVSDVGDVLVSAPGNRVVPARSLLTVEPGNSPVEIERKNQERISRVNAELDGHDRLDLERQTRELVRLQQLVDDSTKELLLPGESGRSPGRRRHT